MSLISVSGIHRKYLLSELYETAKPLYVDREGDSMSTEHARVVLEERNKVDSTDPNKYYFVQIGNRRLEIDLQGKSIDTTRYDELNGFNMGLKAVTTARWNQHVDEFHDRIRHAENRKERVRARLDYAGQWAADFGRKVLNYYVSPPPSEDSSLSIGE